MLMTVAVVMAASALVIAIMTMIMIVTAAALVVVICVIVVIVEVVRGIVVVLVELFVLVIQMGVGAVIFGRTRPVKTSLAHLLLFAIQQRKRRRSHVDAADDGQQLENAHTSFKLRKNQVDIVRRAHCSGKLTDEHLDGVRAAEALLGNRGKNLIGVRGSRTGATLKLDLGCGVVLNGAEQRIGLDSGDDLGGNLNGKRGAGHLSAACSAGDLSIAGKKLEHGSCVIDVGLLARNEARDVLDVGECVLNRRVQNDDRGLDGTKIVHHGNRRKLTCERGRGRRQVDKQSPACRALDDAIGSEICILKSRGAGEIRDDYFSILDDVLGEPTSSVQNAANVRANGVIACVEISGHAKSHPNVNEITKQCEAEAVLAVR